jgi:hypothetical protein
LPCISVITTDNTDTDTSIANRVTAQATDPFRCSKLLRRQLLYYSKGSTSCPRPFRVDVPVALIRVFYRQYLIPLQYELIGNNSHRPFQMQRLRRRSILRGSTRCRSSSGQAARCPVSVITMQHTDTALANRCTARHRPFSKLLRRRQRYTTRGSANLCRQDPSVLT